MPADPVATPPELFYNIAAEKEATGIYSVLKTYPGAPMEWGSRADRLSVQVQTLGSDAAALARAQAIYECFTDGTGHPLRMKTFDGFLAGTTTADGTYMLVAA